MRILDCYVSMTGGGLARHMAIEVNSLQSKGHDVSLLLQDKKGEFLSEVSPEVPIVGLGKQGVWSYGRMLWDLINIFQKLKPQIVVSHAWQMDVLVFIASRFLRPRPRMVFFFHTIVEGFALTKSIFGKIRAHLLKQMASYVYRQSDAIVAVSPDSKNGLVKKFGVPDDRIVVIPSLWDMERTLSDAGELVDHPWFHDKGIPVIVGCGALLPTKNFALLLKAFAIVQKQRKARLVLIGGGYLRSELLQLAKNLGIEEDFCLLGFQYNSAKYMVRAKVFVLSSVVEGFPLVLLEALLLGVPIVATDVGGVAYALDEGRYGILVPPNDEIALAKGICKLLVDTTMQKEFSLVGPSRAKMFAPEKLLEKNESIITGIGYEI